MTYKEIYEALLETEYPVTVNFWEKEIPALPYIVIEYPENNDVTADDINYANIVQVNIGLYTKRKDTTAETAVETVITKYFGAYFKTSEWVLNDHLQETNYTTEVVING